MNSPQTDEGSIRGERTTPMVSARRGVSSRMSSILAVGLMSVLGLGLLSWYYAGAMTRQSAARQAAQEGARRRAQGDLQLPPLGTMALRVRSDGLDAGPSASAATAALPLEVVSQPDLTAPVLQSEAHLPPGSAPPEKTPAQLALERQLSGAAFAAQASAGVTVRDPGSRELGSPGNAAAGTLATLLKPGASESVRAELLPTTRLLLPKGAFIDCTLETAIDSTLPGMTTCVTATDTFGVDGKVVLLERGTKLVGETRGQLQQGAARVFVLWNEARTPTGVIVPLASPAADELGRSGLPGQINRHFWERFGAAMLISVLDGAVQAAVQSSSTGGTVVLSPAASAGVATEVLKSTVAIAPTVQKSQGDRIQVLVARNLDFRSVYALRADEALP